MIPSAGNSTSGSIAVTGTCGSRHFGADSAVSCLVSTTLCPAMLSPSHYISQVAVASIPGSAWSPTEQPWHRLPPSPATPARSRTNLIFAKLYHLRNHVLRVRCLTDYVDLPPCRVEMTTRLELLTSGCPGSKSRLHKNTRMTAALQSQNVARGTRAWRQSPQF